MVNVVSSYSYQYASITGFVNSDCLNAFDITKQIILRKVASSLELASHLRLIRYLLSGKEEADWYRLHVTLFGYNKMVSIR